MIQSLAVDEIHSVQVHYTFLDSGHSVWREYTKKSGVFQNILNHIQEDYTFQLNW